MKHTPFIRVVQDTDTAVLMIHGIVGTPDHFKDLLPLIPEDWSVYNILLDSHRGEVKDFSHTSMGKWNAQAHSLLDEILLTHRGVLIVAHPWALFLPSGKPSAARIVLLGYSS